MSTPTVMETLKDHHRLIAFATHESKQNSYITDYTFEGHCPSCQALLTWQSRASGKPTCPTCQADYSPHYIVEVRSPQTARFHFQDSRFEVSETGDLDLIFAQATVDLTSLAKYFKPGVAAPLLTTPMVEVGRLRFLTHGGVEVMGQVDFEGARLRVGEALFASKAALTANDLIKYKIEDTLEAIQANESSWANFKVFSSASHREEHFIETTHEMSPAVESHPIWQHHHALHYASQILKYRFFAHHIGFSKYQQEKCLLPKWLYRYVGFEWLMNRYPVTIPIYQAGLSHILTHWVDQLLAHPKKNFKLALYFKEAESLPERLLLPDFIVEDFVKTNPSFETLFRLQKIHQLSPICQSSYDVFKDMDSELNLKLVNRLIREKEASFNQVVLYLESCRARQALPLSVALETWDAYFKLSRDLNLPVKRFPLSVLHGYDLINRDRRALESNKPKVYRQRALPYEEALTYDSPTHPYSCRALLDYHALIKEQRLLHHSLTPYEENIENGESLLIAIRETSNLEAAYYTAEFCLTTHRILQVRGKDNRGPQDKGLKAFLQELEAHLQVELAYLKAS